jgi:hypothetical protein
MNAGQIQLNAESVQAARAAFAADGHQTMRIGFQYDVTCRDADGNEKWNESFHNLVPDQGLDQFLNSLTAAALTLYVGLADGTPTQAATDTMASHPGWVEITAYTESPRPTCTLGAASGQSRSNVGNEAVFTINADSQVIGGAFITTDSTKGGTAGVLMSIGDFTQLDRNADTGDTLTVTVTLTLDQA